MSEIVYKLPPEFIARHQELLDSHDWAVRPRMFLKEKLPDIPELEGVVLEYAMSATRQGPTAVVRATTLAGSVVLRRYADGFKAASESE